MVAGCCNILLDMVNILKHSLPECEVQTTEGGGPVLSQLPFRLSGNNKPQLVRYFPLFKTSLMTQYLDHSLVRSSSSSSSSSPTVITIIITNNAGKNTQHNISEGTQGPLPNTSAVGNVVPTVITQFIPFKFVFYQCTLH